MADILPYLCSGSDPGCMIRSPVSKVVKDFLKKKNVWNLVQLLSRSERARGLTLLRLFSLLR